MKYDLVGVDGNAFAVMGYVLKAMKEWKSVCNRKSVFAESSNKGL